MSVLSLENPVFASYLIAASIMILKIMLQGWITVYRMLKSNSGLASPEDLQVGIINKNPSPEQLDINDYVDRSRRMHNNDLENIPAFLACGILFVFTGPSYLLANILLFGFTITRLMHSVAYATKQSHEIRATFYTIGSVIVIVMAVYVLMTGLKHL